MVREQLGRQSSGARALIETACAMATVIEATPDEVFTAAVELLSASYVGFRWKTEGPGTPVPELREFEADLAATLVACCARHGVEAQIIRWNRTEDGRE